MKTPKNENTKIMKIKHTRLVSGLVSSAALGVATREVQNPLFENYSTDSTLLIIKFIRVGAKKEKIEKFNSVKKLVGIPY